MIEIDKINWSEEKNAILREERGVCFEDVIASIKNDQSLAIEAGSPNYPHQRVLIVNIRDYAYMVPMVISEQEIFLKTIIPSRKHTKKYLRGN